MFKLYGNIESSWKKLDIAVDEKDIVNSMIDYSNKYGLYDYLVVQREKDFDDIYLRIRNKDEFETYLLTYSHKIHKLEDMSCVDLKKYIIKKKDKKNGSK